MKLSTAPHFRWLSEPPGPSEGRRPGWDGRWIILILLIPIFTQAQIIATYGGGGTSGLCEGCPATAATITDPTRGVFDRYGNYYFASCLGGNRIQRISITGIITTVAGNGSGGFSGDGGPATAAKLNTPTTAKFDSTGNIYISDAGNYRIRKVNVTTGIISTIAGIGIGGYNGDGIPATNAEFGTNDICLDRFGNIYIADYNARRVRKINAAGIISTVAGNGTIGSTGDGGPAISAQLSPNGIVLDDTGNLYIADPYANVVRKINTIGIISTVAGNGAWIYSGDNIPATDAQIQPAHIAIDSFNNLYIGDAYNRMVFKVDTAGILHHVAGNGMTGFSGDGGPSTAASLDYPSGVSIDACGNLYITEANNRRIRKINFDPSCNPYTHFDSGSLRVNTLPPLNFNIYPNPAYNTVTIIAANIIKQITITNTIGQTVYNYAAPGCSKGEESVEVSIAGLPEGIYIVKVTDNEGKTTVNKIVKQ